MMKDSMARKVRTGIMVSLWVVIVAAGIQITVAMAGCGDGDPACGCFGPLPTAPIPAPEIDIEIVLPPGGSESLPFADEQDATTPGDGTTAGSGSGAVPGGSNDDTGTVPPRKNDRGIGGCVSDCVHCGYRGRDCVRICKEQVR